MSTSFQFPNIKGQISSIKQPMNPEEKSPIQQPNTANNMKNDKLLFAQLFKQNPNNNKCINSNSLKKLENYKQEVNYIISDKNKIKLKLILAAVIIITVASLMLSLICVAVFSASLIGFIYSINIDKGFMVALSALSMIFIPTGIVNLVAYSIPFIIFSTVFLIKSNRIINILEKMKKYTGTIENFKETDIYRKNLTSFNSKLSWFYIRVIQYVILVVKLKENRAYTYEELKNISEKNQSLKKINIENIDREKFIKSYEILEELKKKKEKLLYDQDTILELILKLKRTKECIELELKLEKEKNIKYTFRELKNFSLNDIKDLRKGYITNNNEERSKLFDIFQFLEKIIKESENSIAKEILEDIKGKKDGIIERKSYISFEKEKEEKVLYPVYPS